MRALHGPDGVLRLLDRRRCRGGRGLQSLLLVRFGKVSGCGGRTCGAALVEAFFNDGVVFLSFVGLASTTVCRRERRRGVQKHFLQAHGGDAGAKDVEAF